MDTHIKLVKENGTPVFIGASNFGYENLMFRVFDILVRILNKEEVYPSEKSFLGINFKSYQASQNEEFEAIIDAKHHLFYFLNGFTIYDLKETSVKEELGINEDEVLHVDFSSVNLLLKNKMSFEEFKVLYKFIKPLFKEDAVVINNRYLYIPDIEQ